MAGQKSLNSWIVLPKANPQAHLRLFCFPFAGGGTAVFRTWPSQLPPEVEVCAVRLPGRETRLREPAFTHLSPLVEAVAEALQPYCQQPFALFGHSMGALVCYQLAQYLRQENVQPVHLFIAGYAAPHRPPHLPPVHEAADDVFLARLRHLNGTPPELLNSAGLMGLMLPTLRADFAVWETYVYAHGTPLACPISAFGGRQDDEATQADMAAWRDYTHSAFSLRMFPGGHFFVQEKQAELLQAISRDLMPYLR
jgi:medium-chain acyl-[acyl-carrier-protein] hydrolase